MSNGLQQFIYSEELYQLPARVIVLLPLPWAKTSDEEKVLLAKILSAARLSMQGVQILTYTHVTVEHLKVFNPSVIISFGTDITPATELYKSKNIEGITVIRSDQLSGLDDAKKKELWGALKTLMAA